MLQAPARQFRIIGALMRREMSTRFGREGLGFAWVIGEPLLFCFGVLLLWSAIKPEYEHGIRIGPFIMTGYMCLLLYRHMISFSVGALSGNVGLLHHRQIRTLHIFLARNLLEFLGGTAAFIIVYIVLLALGQVELPHNWLLLYAGWFTTAWVGFGIGLAFAGLSSRFDIMERLVPVLTYSMIPISGAFFMLHWIPQQFREVLLWFPFPHGIEMVRDGVFGHIAPTYYNASYAWFMGAVMLVFGLLLLAGAKNRVDLE